MLIDQKNAHGGDIYSNDVLLDFSSNVNPYGMPETVKEAAASSIEKAALYPDPYCRALREAIAKKEKVETKHILCGNGAAELIYSYAYSLPKGRPALIVSPSFCEYGKALDAAGIVQKHYVLSEENGFKVTKDFLKTDFNNYSAVFICTPGNPTGVSVDKTIIEETAKTRARLFIDMCFADLADRGGLYDVPRLISKYPSVTVLKAFTKSYGMAGIRLGYVMCCDDDLLRTMSDKTQCWNVSSVAQASGIAALDCDDWISEKRELIKKERRRVADELRSYGIRVYESEANYLLLYSEYDLYGLLLGQKILARDCSDYVGLKKGYIRVAIKTKEQNDRLLSAIRGVIK